jgi:phage terminase small subunit
MPILTNPRHERFAQALAQGKTADEAYVLAGYAANRGNSATLKKKQIIQNRLSELLERRDTVEAQATERAIAKLAITKESVLGELAKIGFANMADYMTVGPDGAPTLNFKDLTREQAAALIEITVEEFRDGRTDAREVRRVKFKLADKKGALVDLGKHLGLFIERHEIGDPGEFARMTDDELNSTLGKFARAAGLPESVVARLTTDRSSDPDSTLN